MPRQSCMLVPFHHHGALASPFSAISASNLTGHGIIIVGAPAMLAINSNVLLLLVTAPLEGFASTVCRPTTSANSCTLLCHKPLLLSASPVLQAIRSMTLLQVKAVLSKSLPPHNLWQWLCGGLTVLDALLVICWAGIMLAWVWGRTAARLPNLKGGPAGALVLLQMLLSCFCCCCCIAANTAAAAAALRCCCSCCPVLLILLILLLLLLLLLLNCYSCAMLP